MSETPGTINRDDLLIMPFPKLIQKPLILFIILGFFLYLPSLFGPFLWDDEDFVFANKYVTEFRLDKFFTEDAIAGRGKVSNYYRPIPQIVYATTHSLFGLNPFWYHLVSILFHSLSAFTVYFFLKTFIEKILPRGSLTLVIPLTISLVFLVHPVQTETVSYISGLSDSLFVLFGFLSLTYFLSRHDRYNMVPLSLVFFLLSILSKETGLVFLPILIITYVSEYLSTLKKINIRSFLKILDLSPLKLLLPYVLIAITYLWYHQNFINNLDIRAIWESFNPLYANSIVVRLLTFVQSLFSYVGLLIFPKDLYMERDSVVQIQQTLFNPSSIFFVLINLAVLFSLYHLRKREVLSNGSLILLFFFFAAFYMSFIPYSGLVLINGVFYEHFLYLPLVSFFAFFVILFFEVTKDFQNRRFFKSSLLVLFVFVLALFSARNLARQLDWLDAVRFYSQILSYVPQSVRAKNGLGMAYAEKGDDKRAIAVYKDALKTSPNIPNLYHNLANSYEILGDYSEAEKYYLLALEVNPNFIFSALSLARLYHVQGKSERLAELLTRYPQLHQKP